MSNSNRRDVDRGDDADFDCTCTRFVAARYNKEIIYELLDKYSPYIAIATARVMEEFDLSSIHTNEINDAGFKGLLTAIKQYDPSSGIYPAIFVWQLIDGEANTRGAQLRFEKRQSLVAEAAINQERMVNFADNPSGDFGDQEERKISRMTKEVDEGLRTIRTDYRTVILLYNYEGKSEQEVAQMMSIHECDVKPLLYEALTQLFEALERKNFVM